MSQTAIEQRIAIVGTGCRFPGSANSPAKLWDLLQRPRDLARKIPSARFNIDGFYHQDGKHHGTTNAREAYLLDEEISAFDAPFFNISSSEAESIDPQQRILLETVFESLDSAGLRLEDLRGTSTGVFCGVMCDDYGGVLYRDIDALPQYTATGTSRSILSNRVSYFFDWKGPSITIDTACSSSLVALHMAVKALNDRECPIAVAAGANLIFAPNMFVSESNLSMLSPTGRSRMWDAAADGYARGEGIAAVVLKRLEDAIADGDTVECVIRAAHVNQDGRSAGITMPSSAAQKELIRATYEKAGLDLTKSADRCQYFEAHGTGTPAGDPQEASAIAAAFFDDQDETGFDKLHVGSIKTIIGHTEGCAGLAGLIKAWLAMKNGTIPPNLHFNRISPKVEPYYKNLHVPTKLQQWPDLPPGVPRRCSINSFGFGGTNAHVILESYELQAREVPPPGVVTVLPIVFSAPSERALTAVLAKYKQFLREHQDVNIHDLAWTLFARRSTFTFKIHFSAQNIKDLQLQIDAELELRSNGEYSSISSRIASNTQRILGIFTGQGAQWPRMGYELIKNLPMAKKKFDQLDEALATLPQEHRPDFSLLDELAAEKQDSRISKAAISQPLCTAVQIVLVDLLRAGGVTFDAVVGHSSGEIAAAYAAGYLNATESIRIAYYRGFFAKLAGSNGKHGAMLAVGMDLEEARSVCDRPEFRGRVTPAASNSSASVTLSGDADAISEIEIVLKDEEKFARMLKVDTAYHSHHMLPCSESYVTALESCKIEPRQPTGCKWYSSVHDGNLMQASDELKARYWKDNMVNTVLFSQALSAAVRNGDKYNLIIEVGPHPALKGPALQVISDVHGSSDNSPYTGVLKRDSDDVNSFASAIGMTWATIGVDRAAARRLWNIVTGDYVPTVLKSLPNFPFDRDRSYWAESRISKALQKRKDPPNILLGSRIPDAAEEEWRWRNYLRPSEIEWLEGHQIQSQTVFPATGYIAMALEAAKVIAAGQELHLVEIEDFRIGRAIAFNDDWRGVETLFKIDNMTYDKGGDTAVARFGCHANQGGILTLCAEGLIRLTFGTASPATLPPRSPEELDLMELDVAAFYTYLKGLGYGYTGLFEGLFSLMRKQDTASGFISNSCLRDPKPVLQAHPALMDTLLQTLLASVGHPGDGRLFSLHVPTSIEKISINPFFCGEAWQGLGEHLAFDCSLTNYSSDGARGDIDLFTSNGESAIIQMEQVHVSPLMAPGPEDDRLLFSEVTWGPMHPNAMFPSVSRCSETAEIVEKLSLCYLNHARNSHIAKRKDSAGLENPVIKKFSHLLGLIKDGKHPNCSKEWLVESIEDVEKSCSLLPQTPDLHTVKRSSAHLMQYLQHEGIDAHDEHLSDSSFMDQFEKCEDLESARSVLGELVGQLAFRFPRMKIMEIGGRHGLTTEHVLSCIDSAYHSYTFTDPSETATQQAKHKFSGTSERLFFKPLDVNIDPSTQDLKEHHYDLVIVSNITSINKSYTYALSNLRKLLKPGGYALLVEGVDNNTIRLPYLLACLGKLWLDEDNAGTSHMLPSKSQWHELLQRTGFSGVDSLSFRAKNAVIPASLIVTQALDDTIRFIRDPLDNASNFEKLNELIIIGGRSKFTSSLIEQVSPLVFPLFHQLRVATDLNSIENTDSSLSTILCLAEIDGPVFKDINERQLTTLQKLLNSSKNLLWVSTGSKEDKLYESMTPAVLRSVAYELPHLFYQYFQIKNADEISAQKIANALLRVAFFDSYNEIGCPEILWATEAEIFLDSGIIQIPRIRTSEAMNRRYMAGRRVVKENLDPNQEAMAVICNEKQYEIETILPSGSPDEEKVEIRTEFCTLSAIKTKGGSHFHLVLGKRSDSSQVLALSHMNATFVPVHHHCCVDCEAPSNGAEYLASVSAYLVADYLTSIADPGSTLLVHEPDQLLEDAIVARSRPKNIKTYFTTIKDSVRNQSRIFLHPRSSVRLLKASLPSDISVFVNLQREQALVCDRLREAIPSSAQFENVNSLYFAATPTEITSVPHEAAESLHMAHLMSKPQNPEIQEQSSIPIDAMSLSGTSEALTKLAVVDWTNTSEIPAKVHTASSHVSLRPNRTYLLVGLTGDLGRSVCRWMIGRGARNLVLTSRKPSIDSEWIAQMEALGARVVVLSMDVTNKASIREMNDFVRENLPSVGGVINGAMVLKDVLFSDMSLETLHSTLKPKVEGSLNLSNYYWDTELDFFILFGSLAAVAGNRGQSAYAAANTFMSSLAKRRRAHGRAASIINPGEIRGVGYVARMGQALQDDLDSLGYLATSEQDLHELFAEAILAGSPESDRNPELIAGPLLNDPEINPDVIWFANTLLWHFIVYDAASSSGPSAEGNVSIRDQLKPLSSHADIHAAIVSAFSQKIRSKLQLSEDDDLSPDTLLIELGVDSLNAVDLRAWFVKELSADIPILKFVGGSSIQQIVDEVVAKLPESIVPNYFSEESSTAASNDGNEQTKPEVDSPPITHKRNQESISKLSQKSYLTSSPMLKTQSFDSELGRTDTMTSSGTSVFSEPGSANFTCDDVSDTSQPEPESLSPPAKLEYERVEKLSYAQARYWFLTQYLEDKSAYNVTLYERVYGQVRIEDMKSAVDTVARRHDTLRTCYIRNEEGEACQAILPRSRVHLETCLVQSEDEADIEFQKIRDHVYDLENGEVARLRFVTMGPNQHFFIVGYHHMCLDASSLHVMLSELERAYTKQSLPAVTLQYPDYAVKQRTAFMNGQLDDQIGFWKSKFPALPEPMPLLPMSKVRSRPVLTQYELDDVVLRVDTRIVKKIRAGCKKQRATPFHFFLAVLRTIIVRMIDTDDICIGVADANRLDSDCQGMIGFLLNLLPLHFHSDTTKETFGTILTQTRDKAYKALRNSKVPFDKLLEELNVPRSAQHSPLFQVLMDWQPATKDKNSFGPHKSETKEICSGNTPYDLTLLVTETSQSDMKINFRFQKSLFERSGSEVFARSYMKLVNDFASNFNEHIMQPHLYEESDIESALSAGRGREMDSSWPETVLDRIVQLANSQPSHAALTDGTTSLTYGEMLQISGQVATVLASAGVVPGSPVALFQQPSSYWVCCMLAIWRLNGIYVPLDLRAPLPRLSTMVNDCEPTVILYHNETASEVESLKHAKRAINVDEIDFVKTTAYTSYNAQPESSAVILYTSGSTGKPKGIVLRHSSLRWQVEGYGSEWDIREERVLQQGAMTFNHSLDQMFTGLCNGGSLFVVPRHLRGDPVSLSKLIAREKITYTKATPAEYSAWLTYGFEHLRTASHWRLAFGGGEHFSTSLARSFRALQLSNLRLFNSYGPGEITISSHKMEIFYRDVEDFHSNIYPVGFSLPNYNTYIVDKHQRPVPVGVSGEILVGGSGPCVGYLGREELNREKFIQNPFMSARCMQRGWSKAYRTFDRGHLLPDGSLVIEGRLDGDTQVKLRGIRMELEDIENAIVEVSSGNINQATVTLREEQSQFLVAHVGFSPHFGSDEDEEKASYLKQLVGKLPLPQYMCPTAMIPLDHFPLNVHGKVDRKAIASLELPRAAAKTDVDHKLSEAESKMRYLWSQVLDERFTDVSDISRDTNFFLVGGSSVLLVKLQSVISEQLHVTIPLMELFETSSLGDMTAKAQATAETTNIDWASEVAIDDVVASLRPTRRLQETRAGFSVILTGATGFLGGHILEQLCESSAVAQVHAVAVRPHSEKANRLKIESSKISVHTGDLKDPLFGLSQAAFDDLAASADMVIHCGANRSFWDSYFSLRSTNVNSTKTVISLAAGKRIPIHFLSSGGVGEIDHHPPVDGSDGYLASKWASEQLLRNAATELAISVTVHRPTRAKVQRKPDKALKDELQRMVEQLQCVPIGGSWSGSFTLVPAKDVALNIVDRVTAEDTTDSLNFDVVMHEASMSVGTDDVIAAVSALTKYKDLEKLSAIRWLGRAKRQGFTYLVAGQDATIGKPQDGAAHMRSRR